MRRLDIYLYDITYQHTIYMVKIFLPEIVDLCVNQQHLFLRSNIMEDKQRLIFDNMNNHYINTFV